MMYIDVALSELLSILVRDDMKNTVNQSSTFVGLKKKKKIIHMINLRNM